ncbi:DUF262 domain-containing protein [Pseudonocardia asaccharolytica]|uniref:GmrSD restriction endonucleases N-terminal domain-containing protein n=1 Tax=Pseudonocardia asaccharolytica DSM 44247 = NBRC 16224 TaxID=1123024 RepID=A0A511D0R4_9PSEU|nr:DUF262 domain-containing protein [Pseudonocardia asaccharolytica]GEL18380.1 hypothetical protein PA7_22170 [Pseudonocardia asaccharolytica DSM 44247 = NBRC 16224]
MTKLSTILDQIDAGSMLLPEFQRGYVWNRDQVRGLMRSLYHGYPVGALLVWETEGTGQAVRGGGAVSGPKQLLLDGQQRVTTLYGIVRGRPPSFFEGDPEAFAGLRFNVETEAFQFHAPVKMKDDPRWVDVTALFVDGPGETYAVLSAHPETRERFTDYVDRLQKVRNIVERVFHIEAITGVDKTVDVVVDIFNRVNSGGTKLSKGDLALARICSEWGEARPTMRRNLDRWRDAGFSFTADWLLRNVNAVATGRAPFSALEDVSAAEFQDALNATLHHVDHFLRDLAVGRLGLDHDRVLMGRYAVPVISRHLHNCGGRFADGAEADKALYWYLHAGLRGRFAGSTETFLAKDLETVDKSGIDGVIATLARIRKGNMAVDAQDFEGIGRGSRSYPLVYLLARVTGGQDLITGLPLGSDASAVQVHEIFPKPALNKAGYSRAEVNQIANFTFVTPSSAMQFADLDPAVYLGSLDPATCRSQYIPEDPALWRIENYREFLAARRELLAAAANTFLDELLAGSRPWVRPLEAIAVSPESDESDARAAQLKALVEELAGMGYAQPVLDTEIADPDTGRPLAVAEAFWPDGLQVGQGAPIVLELDPEEADLPRLAELGCEVFTSVDALRGYALRRSETASGVRDVAVGVVAPGLAPEGAEPTDLDEPAEASGPFDRAVLEVIERCRTELRYNPRYFRVMVTQHGALGAARRLLAAPAVSDGFVTLWERQRLDLSVESLVVDERFAHLFTEEERETARKRLADFGYDPVPE